MLIVKNACSAKIHINYIDKENLIKMCILMLRLPDILQSTDCIIRYNNGFGKKACFTGANNWINVFKIILQTSVCESHLLYY